MLRNEDHRACLPVVKSLRCTRQCLGLIFLPPWHELSPTVMYDVLHPANVQTSNGLKIKNISPDFLPIHSLIFPVITSFFQFFTSLFPIPLIFSNSFPHFSQFPSFFQFIPSFFLIHSIIFPIHSIIFHHYACSGSVMMFIYRCDCDKFTVFTQ